MGFFDFFRKLKVKVADGFKKLFGQQAAEDFGKAALQLLESAAGKIAVQVVLAIETMNPLASPADKRLQAFKQIADAAKQQGLSVADSIINLLIELAVQAIVKQSYVPVPNM